MGNPLSQKIGNRSIIIEVLFSRRIGPKKGQKVALFGQVPQIKKICGA
jgi:hypothetical protein